MRVRSPVFLSTLFALMAVGVFMLLSAPGSSAQTVSSTPIAGEPQIGGAYTLTDMHGKERKSEEFLGKIQLVYFGFSHCPDICPVDTANISEALTKMGKDADQFQGLFITLDPERDTPERMKAFMANFDSRFLGLTGTQSQVDHATKAFRIYAAKVQKEDAEGYAFDHSAMTYVLDRKGNFVTYFPSKTPPAHMVKELIPLLARSQKDPA
jgi:protein SCO1/2